jgi:hypothetical protein
MSAKRQGCGLWTAVQRSHWSVTVESWGKDEARRERYPVGGGVHRRHT